MKPKLRREPKLTNTNESFLNRIDVLSLVKWGIIAFFILFLFIPLFSVFIVSFTGQPVNIFGSLINPDILAKNLERLSNSSLEHYLKLAEGGTYFKALVNSLALSFGVSILVILMCLPIAYGLARTTMRFKKLFAALCIIPLIVPTFVSAAGFILMFGRAGWITHIYQSLGGEGALFNVYSMAGIVMVQIFFFFPFALWPMVAAFKASDVTLEEASNNLGSKNWITMLFVTVPLAIPGIISSALLIFTVSWKSVV